ncbi:MAG: taurine catabolism dioxygenase TauD [Xanthomonadales bacterium]|nr:taurine catabolism dioxygenase TauD [Xanthomonadales bacterium]
MKKPLRTHGFLREQARYLEWKEARLNNYPRAVEELVVEIDGLSSSSATDRAAINAICTRSNMAIYRCRDKSVDRQLIREFASRFGLTRLDHHLCANPEGVSELSVAASGVRSDYVPYSNRGLSWHTDGYYNDKPRQINAVLLHCARCADSGGENALLDPEIAYILLRDEDPRFIEAFEHPDCMTIPPNENAGGEIRPEIRGPVFSYDAAGRIHMRYSARKKNIRWRDDALTRSAREYLTELLEDKGSPVLRYRLRPGEGLISNNVLHNRTAFTDKPGNNRLLYRARFFDRIGIT